MPSIIFCMGPWQASRRRRPQTEGPANRASCFGRYSSWPSSASITSATRTRALPKIFHHLSQGQPGPDPALIPGSACLVFRSLSIARFLGSAPRLSAGGAGWSPSSGRQMNSAPNQQAPHSSALKLVGWTFGPIIFFILMALIFGKTHQTLTFQKWSFPLILVAAGAGQCRAFVMSNNIDKNRPILIKAFAFMLTLFSLMLLLFWVGLFVMSAYHLLNPTASPLFGGR